MTRFALVRFRERSYGRLAPAFVPRCGAGSCSSLRWWAYVQDCTSALLLSLLLA